MTTNYSNACDLILSVPVPLLYIDTCVFLDIIRSPIRENIIADYVRFAQDLQRRSVENPRSVWLVTSETVQLEWSENLANVKKEVERDIRKLESSRKHFLSAAKAITEFQYPHDLSESSLDLVTQLEAASKALLDACIIIPPEAVHSFGAMNRVKLNIPPAKRGKAEAKDCEIYEIFFSLCKDLRAKGMEEQLVFVSSNTKEYGGGKSSGVQPELDGVSAKFSSNLSWAMAAADGCD